MKKKYAITLLSVGLIVSGIYVLILALSPALLSSGGPKKAEVTKFQNNTVYLPKLNKQLAFLQGGETVLDKGLWHRSPANGNPEEGGNFVLAGHRYTLATTPARTIVKSPLYKIDQLAEKDKIFVDYQDRRYEYSVEKVYSVKPNDVSIEDRAPEPRLTLYTCTKKGEADGRVVVIAKLTDKDVPLDKEI